MRLTLSIILLLSILMCGSSALLAQDPARDQDKASAGSELGKPAAVPQKRRKRSPAVIHEENQNKTVVPEGGAKEPPEQIAAGLAPEERARERREAEQWLSATDGDLKILADRHLSPPRQESLKQVKYYLADARVALKEGDFRRAHTLALKAHLLTDDMVHH